MLQQFKKPESIWEMDQELRSDLSENVITNENEYQLFSQNSSNSIDAALIS